MQKKTCRYSRSLIFYSFLFWVVRYTKLDNELMKNVTCTSQQTYTENPDKNLFSIAPVFNVISQTYDPEFYRERN